MKFFLIIPYYLSWHYSKGVVDFLRIWKNFIIFAFSLFPVGFLLKTFLMPAFRITEKYNRNLDVEDLIGSLIVNLLMIAIGVFLRTILIILGLCAGIFVILAGLIMFFAWILAPAVYLAVLGVALISLSK